MNSATVSEDGPDHRTDGPQRRRNTENFYARWTSCIADPLFYKGMLLSEHRPDLVVAEAVIVEVKAVERLDKSHMAQMLTYLRVTGLHIGLILNFNSAVLKHGVRRVIL